METTTKLYEILYVSTIADDALPGVVRDIAASARIFNEAHDISGLLIFDGMHFCQQLEGNQKQVFALLDRITRDPRHTQVEVLHHAALAGRRFKRFSLGYTHVDDADVLGHIEQLDGQQAMDAFMALLSTLDLGT